ncbi:MAG: PilX N-terminal domain-containing pilus assembly protein [Terriglobales bacterium]
MTTQASRFRTRIRAGLLGSRTSRLSRKQSGIALITTLLLLILLSLLGLTMAVTANSDMLINSYYGSYRGSFYAADSGLNIARAAMSNQIQNAVTTTACAGWGAGGGTGCTSAPLNGTTAASTAQTYVTSAPYTSFASLNAGQATNSWPANYMLPSSITGCTTGVTFPTAGVTNPQILTTNGSLTTSYQYTFNYTLCAVGRAQGLQQVATKEVGNLIVTVTAQSSSSTQVTTSFAAFGAFINNQAECSGAQVTGTMTGPFFTNGSWNFGTGGSYIFTDPVGQVDPNASYMFSSGHCDAKNASSDSYNGTSIAPTFQAGFNRNQPAAALPGNDFSQQWAVIDGVGCGEKGTTCNVTAPPAPTSTGSGNDLDTNLKSITGAVPSSSSSGVYIPYCPSACPTGVTPNTIYGGGFYIKDTASISTNITLSLGSDGSGNPTQIYTITQGSPATSTVITLNIVANTTTVSQTNPSAATLTLTGVPQNKAGATPTEGAMLYVNGTVSSLQGPGQGTASIQDYYGTTVSASGSIDVTGDLIYKHEPVTLNVSDTLVAGNDFNQVLGLYTANGDIVESSSYSNGNLEVDAAMAAMSSACTASSSSSICGFATSGHVNTLTIVGGRIESNAHSVSLNTVNTYFDRRFTSRQGFAPPFFPSTTLPQNDINSASAPLVIPSTQRLTWVTWPQ